MCVRLLSHDFQKKVKVKEEEKQRILEESKDLTERSSHIATETEKKNQDLKNVEKYVWREGLLEGGGG